MPEESGGWRIDDLARRTSLTVDTIRFYQREGLLQPAARVGRTKEFGPDHLARLERIRELQTKRFSLAAIRALLDADRGADLVEEVFAGDIGVSYTLEELIQKSGINEKTVAVLRSERLLRDPAEFGQSTYDANDLDMIRAVGELSRLGIPNPILIELARIYVDGVESMQSQVVEIFSGQSPTSLTPEEFVEFRSNADSAAHSLYPLFTRVVEYLHKRTTQRLALKAIELRAALPQTEGE